MGNRNHLEIIGLLLNKDRQCSLTVSWKCVDESCNLCIFVWRRHLADAALQEFKCQIFQAYGVGFEGEGFLVELLSDLRPGNLFAYNWPNQTTIWWKFYGPSMAWWWDSSFDTGYWYNLQILWMLWTPPWWESRTPTPSQIPPQMPSICEEPTPCCHSRWCSIAASWDLLCVNLKKKMLPPENMVWWYTIVLWNYINLSLYD